MSLIINPIVKGDCGKVESYHATDRRESREAPSFPSLGVMDHVCAGLGSHIPVHRLPHLERVSNSTFFPRALTKGFAET